MLDCEVRNAFKNDNFESEFKKYKAAKTDIYTNKVKIQMGVDGISWETFEKSIKTIGIHVCKRVLEGRYFFSPFREHEVPKPPFTNLSEAKKAKKTRILSIATIKDVIFQKLFYNAIEDFCELKFSVIQPDVSYAYRKGKSAPLAVRRIFDTIVEHEYFYALDGDIKKFFDEIPHDKLYIKINNFIGKDNILTVKYLKRFFSADRVSFEDYHGKVKKYHNKKPKREIRKKGIPQGGVLSGLVANIFMYDFDMFIINILYSKYNNEIKYFRYADDFVILLKDNSYVIPIYNDIKQYLLDNELLIHDIGDKTKVIDMSAKGKQKLEFLGFEISPKGISAKKANLIKFKKRIVEIINETKIYKINPQKGLLILIDKIRFKILGNQAFDAALNICQICGKQQPKRSWLTYFLIITDVRILRNLDTWIRKNIYHSYYNKTGKRLTKKDLANSKLPSLEKLYYEYKKDLTNPNHGEYCKCISWQDEETEVDVENE